jgi:hypothetical protein
MDKDSESELISQHKEYLKSKGITCTIECKKFDTVIKMGETILATGEYKKDDQTPIELLFIQNILNCLKKKIYPTIIYAKPKTGIYILRFPDKVVNIQEDWSKITPSKPTPEQIREISPYLSNDYLSEQSLIDLCKNKIVNLSNVCEEQRNSNINKDAFISLATKSNYKYWNYDNNSVRFGWIPPIKSSLDFRIDLSPVELDHFMSNYKNAIGDYHTTNLFCKFQHDITVKILGKEPENVFIPTAGKADNARFYSGRLFLGTLLESDIQYLKNTFPNAYIEKWDYTDTDYIIRECNKYPHKLHIADNHPWGTGGHSLMKRKSLHLCADCLKTDFELAKKHEITATLHLNISELYACKNFWKGKILWCGLTEGQGFYDGYSGTSFLMIIDMTKNDPLPDKLMVTPLYIKNNDIFTSKEIEWEISEPNKDPVPQSKNPLFLIHYHTNSIVIEDKDKSIVTGMQKKVGIDNINEIAAFTKSKENIKKGQKSPNWRNLISASTTKDFITKYKLESFFGMTPTPSPIKKQINCGFKF